MRISVGKNGTVNHSAMSASQIEAALGLNPYCSGQWSRTIKAMSL